MKSLSLKDLKKENFLLNWVFLPVFILLAAWYTFSTNWELIYAKKEIEQWKEITERTDTVFMDNMLEETANKTNRYRNTLTLYRESKLEKVSDWSAEESVKELKWYKSFYDSLINDIDDNDFDVISLELAGLAEKAWIQITSLSIWTPKPSKNIIMKWEGVVIFEKQVNITFDDSFLYQKEDLEKMKEKEIKMIDRKEKWFPIWNYKKLKNFLTMLKYDIKTPSFWNIEIAQWKEVWQQISFWKLSLTFFYKWKAESKK